MKENNLKIKKLINFGPSGRAVAQPIDKSLLDNILRVRTNINNLLNIGDKCSISISKNSYYFLYPGAYREYI